ncbi:MAG: LysM peptidoglycan-binding domain-containing protein [Puniceicoccales bacterium]|nr:LysM peptidoglycan-binding domain-containing protein [Puniceicoccales bacterium]
MDEGLSSPSESKLPLILAAVALAAGITGLLFGQSARSKVSNLEKAAETATAQAAEAKSALDSANRNVELRDRQIAELQSDLSKLKQDTMANFMKADTWLNKLTDKVNEFSSGRPVRPSGNTGGTTVTPSGGTGNSGATTVAAAGEHIVKQGENFTVIGRQYGVSARAVEDANPGIDPTRLKIGQKIKVPSRQ